MFFVIIPALENKKEKGVRGWNFAGDVALPEHPIRLAQKQTPVQAVLLFYALDVFAGAGIYFYLIALVNEQWYFYFNAVLGSCRF